MCKPSRHLVGQSKSLPVVYTGKPADIRIMKKHLCISFHYVPMTCWELRKQNVRFYFAIIKNGLEMIDITLK